MLYHKSFISPGRPSIPLATFITELCLFSSTEAITYLYFFPFQIPSNPRNLLFFIPTSFLYEVTFDLFHYTTHRLTHASPKLFQLTHKTHHQYQKPTIFTTYHESILENILTNVIPTVCAMYLLRHGLQYPVSPLEFSCFSVYKAFTEVSGHCGKKLGNVSSFPQCIWLPKLLSIDLYVEDHDHHHSQGRVNFSKRFSLWDKCFGTYASGRRRSPRIGEKRGDEQLG